MELKTCPFCGGEAHISRMPYGSEHKIMCSGCGITIGYTYSHRHPKSVEEATEVWNNQLAIQRAIKAEAKLEKLTTFLSEYKGWFPESLQKELDEIIQSPTCRG